MKKTAVQRQPSVRDFFKQFDTEAKARDYLEQCRWPGGVTCPRCGHDSVYTIKARNAYRCKACNGQFNIRTATVMEASHITLQNWLYGMYLLTIHRKGISSIALSKELGIEQRSAWFMKHRLNEAAKSGGILVGTVEMDEAYIGGKERNKHANKRLNSGRGAVGKSCVLGMKERGGRVIAQVAPDSSHATINAVLADNVADGSTLYTDDHRGYIGLDRYEHASVAHSKRQYVNGIVHTNGIESIWAIVKRAHYGTYHHWSVKHGQRYMDELTFKLNTRGLPAFATHTLTTTRAFMSGMEGRRLRYKELIK